MMGDTQVGTLLCAELHPSTELRLSRIAGLSNLHFYSCSRQRQSQVPVRHVHVSECRSTC